MATELAGGRTVKQRRFLRKVAKDEPGEVLPVKDLVVLIPLFASSIAISWEVGRFMPLGGFLYFSLSEHLLAAMYALPGALILSAFFAVLVIPFWVCWTKSSEPAPDPGQYASPRRRPRPLLPALSDGRFT
jgi:hypothetical protein